MPCTGRTGAVISQVSSSWGYWIQSDKIKERRRLKESSDSKFRAEDTDLHSMRIVRRDLVPDGPGSVKVQKEANLRFNCCSEVLILKLGLALIAWHEIGFQVVGFLTGSCCFSPGRWCRLIQMIFGLRIIWLQRGTQSWRLLLGNPLGTNCFFATCVCKPIEFWACDLCWGGYFHLSAKGTVLLSPFMRKHDWSRWFKWVWTTTLGIFLSKKPWAYPVLKGGQNSAWCNILRGFGLWGWGGGWEEFNSILMVLKPEYLFFFGSWLWKQLLLLLHNNSNINLSLRTPCSSTLCLPHILAGGENSSYFP